MPGPVPQIRWTPSRDQFTATIGGKLRYLGKTKAEAEKQFRFLMQKHDLAEPATNSPTFGEIADAWLEHVQRSHASDRYRNCKAKVNEFLAHLGRDIKVKDLRPHHVEDWIAGKPNLKSPGAKRLYKAMILACLNWAASQKIRLIASNPIKGRLELPEGQSRGGDAVWPDQVFATVIANSNPRYVDFLHALAWTGARPSTIKKIEAKHYNPLLKVWDCEEIYQGRVSKKKYVKRIWLTDDMIGLVERLNKEWPTGPIFRTANGKPFPVDANYLIMVKLRARLKRLGTPIPAGITLYGLRHRFCSRFLTQFPDKLEYLRELMGHKDTTMLRKHYLHLIDAHREIHDTLKGFKV